MNRVIVGGTFILLLLSSPGVIGAGGAPDMPVTVGPRLRVPPLFYLSGPGEGGLSAVELATPPPPSMTTQGGALSLSASSGSTKLPDLFGPRRVELSRYDCALKGAGLGMKLGWVAGCLANNANLWGEKTTWYLAGAAAAAGALFGGTAGADNPSWNVRLQWDADEVDPRLPGDPVQ